MNDLDDFKEELIEVIESGFVVDDEGDYTMNLDKTAEAVISFLESKHIIIYLDEN